MAEHTRIAVIPGDGIGNEVATEGVRVLEAIPHRHKLRTGQLRGNRFEIRVRGGDAAVAQNARTALESTQRSGMVNRFGSQR